jgi:hypothetical protein
MAVSDQIHALAALPSYKNDYCKIKTMFLFFPFLITVKQIMLVARQGVLLSSAAQTLRLWVRIQLKTWI